MSTKSWITKQKFGVYNESLAILLAEVTRIMVRGNKSNEHLPVWYP